MEIAHLTKFEFSELAGIVYKLTGIHLKDSKQTLVVSRLAKRLRVLHLDTFDEYIRYLRSRTGKHDEIPELINAITTNTTEFFREPTHFEFLKNLAPKLYEEGERSGKRILRVWCSASSTGEEPYSIAMVLGNFFESRRGWRVKVLASDIDTQVLKVASRGVYDVSRTHRIPPQLRAKYLTSASSELSPGYVQVTPNLRDMIIYRQINLISDPFLFKEKVDIIFCRNVVIYFDEAGKQKLVNKFAQVLRPGGYIFVGHSESLLIQRDNFEFLGSTIYRRTSI